MRALLTLVLLLIGMSQILPLGHQGLGAESLLAFGFLILAASTVGEIVAGLGLPHIVGYLLAGIVFGPLVQILFGPGIFQLLSTETVQRLNPVSTLAVSMIAYLAGSELRWAEVKEHGAGLLKIVTVELLLNYAVLTGLMYVFTTRFGLLDSVSQAEALAFSLLFSAVAIVHSPAVTLALLSETKARGPVARTTLGVVLVSDVAVVVMFSIAAAAARMIVPTDSAAVISASGVAWEIFGALIVGSALGLGMAFYVRFIRRELLLFGVMIAFLGGEIAHLAHVEVLLTLLVAGFLTENLSGGRGAELRHAMERAAAPIFVVFFALAGAGIDLNAVAALAVFVLPLVVVRAFTIFVGTRLGARWAGVSLNERKYVWLGLVSQSGVAIGLASVMAKQYPVRGVALQSMLLATIAVNELMGPILFRRALVKTGEVQARPGDLERRSRPAAVEPEYSTVPSAAARPAD
ncbi:MAG TPA: cation:proton antiporter [Longimicrobiales bacterium]|nr:cation:proton antiporter [Longimicrobiales bacterium]